MGSKLKTAFEEGLVTGVKLLTALLIVAFGVSWFINDFATIRTGAARGQEAFTYIAAQLQAQADAQETQGITILEEPTDAEARKQDTGS